MAYFKGIMVMIICSGMLSSCLSDTGTLEDIKASIESNEKRISEIKDLLEKLSSKSTPEKESDEQVSKLESKQKEMELISNIGDEKLKHEYVSLLQKLQKLKWEKELISEEFELQQLKDKKAEYEKKKKFDSVHDIFHIPSVE